MLLYTRCLRARRKSWSSNFHHTRTLCTRAKRTCHITFFSSSLFSVQHHNYRRGACMNTALLSLDGFVQSYDDYAFMMRCKSVLPRHTRRPVEGQLTSHATSREGQGTDIRGYFYRLAKALVTLHSVSLRGAMLLFPVAKRGQKTIFSVLPVTPPCPCPCPSRALRTPDAPSALGRDLTCNPHLPSAFVAHPPSFKSRW